MNKARTIVLSTYSTSGSHPWSHIACDGTVTNGNDTFAANVNTSVITEAISSSNNGRSRANSCSHRRKTFKVFTDGDPSNASAAVSNSKWGVWTYPGYPLTNHKVSRLQSVNGWHVYGTPAGTDVPTRWTISGTINEQKLANDCKERARGLKADAMLNAVEANQAWPSLKGLATCLPQMGYNWTRLRKQIRTASGSYLAWKFGVSPILSDVTSIWKYLPKLADDLKRQNERQKQRFSASAELVAEFDSTPVLGAVTQNGYNADVLSFQGRATLPPRVRYVLVVRPKQSPYHSELFRMMDHCMRRFATGPATLAWETIPFSFVVDWFVDLRGALLKVDDILSAPPYEVVSFTRSYNYMLESDVSLQRLSPCNGSTILSVNVGTVSNRNYERSVVQEDLWPSLNVRFGKNQAAVSAALIAQKLSAPKRPR